MSCRDWEGQIALHAGGDLTAKEAANIETHLSTCPPCRKLYAELLADVAALGSLRDEVFPDGLGTTAVVHPAARGNRYWTWTAAAAVLLCASGSLLVKDALKVPAPIRAAIQSPIPPVGWNVVPVHRASVPPRRFVKAKRTIVPREPVVVRIVTDDPDVVIYWITD